MIGTSQRLSRADSRWGILRDLLILAVLCVLSAYVVYFTPQSIAKVFFLIVLLLALISKRDYLWFVYFFVLAEGPGYLFADLSGSSLYRIPLYTIMAGMSFTPIDLFVLLVLVKALIKGRRIKLQLGKSLLIVLVYIIFAVSLSAVLFRTDVDVIATNVRWLFCYSIIVSFSYLVYRKHDIYRFVLLLSSFVFFIFFTQIYYLTTGSEFVNLFDPGYRSVTLNTLTGSLRPVMGGGLIVFASYIFSIILLLDESYRLNKGYLYLVVIVAFMSVFLSATRMWSVIFAFILIGYVVVSRNKLASGLGVVAVFLLLLSLLTQFNIIPLSFLLENSWGRVQQVFDVARGDIYSVDTMRYRLINQLPVLIAIIKQNPFTGFGFSYIAMYYYDSDFGFLNTILMFGVIGLAFFVFFFLRVFQTLVLTIKRISRNNPIKVTLKIMIIIWIGLLIGYFSTWEFFTRFFNKVIFVSILIAFIEFFVMQAKKEEMSVNNT